MRTLRGGIRFVVLVCLVFPAASVRAALYDITFQKIADTDTPVPGGAGNFTGFGTPTNSGFAAQFGGGAGVYGIAPGTAGPVTRFADTATPVPGGTGNFTAFDAPNNGVFRATGGSAQEGVYSSAAGIVSKIADKNTPVPNGTGTFAAFGAGPFRSGASGALFYARGSGAQRGVFNVAAAGGNPVVVADQNTVAPNTAGATFADFGPAVTSQFGTPVYRGIVNGVVGVYGGAAPNPLVVVDPTTTINFNSSLHPQSVSVVNRNAFAGGSSFVVTLAPGIEGVMRKFTPFDPNIESVALRFDNTPGAAAGVHFSDFTTVTGTTGTIESGPITVFRALNDDESFGIYAAFGYAPSVRRVIDTTMTFDGKQVVGVALGDDALYGFAFTFRADFADGSSGVYLARAEVPEPAGAAVAATLLSAALLRRRAR